MNRLVEMNTRVNTAERPTVRFLPDSDGKKVEIVFTIKSEPWDTDPDDPNHPKRDSHRVLREVSGDNLFAGDLSVSLFGLSGQGSLMQLSVRINSKVPGGGGITV